jgi:hypothetical protein
MSANDGKQTSQANARSKPLAGDSTNPPHACSQPSRTDRLREYQKEALSHPKPYIACHADVMGGMLEVFGPVQKFTLEAMHDLAENQTDENVLQRRISPMIKLSREITRHANFLIKMEEHYDRQNARQTSTKPAAANVDPLRAHMKQKPQ